MILAFAKIDIDFDSSDPAQLQLLQEHGGGYFNVFVRIDPFGDPDWAVQNDIEFFDDVEELDGHQHSYVVGLRDLFNGPDAWDLETIEVASSVTAEPLLFPPDDLDWDLYASSKRRNGVMAMGVFFLLMTSHSITQFQGKRPLLSWAVPRARQ